MEVTINTDEELLAHAKSLFSEQDVYEVADAKILTHTPTMKQSDNVVFLRLIRNATLKEATAAMRCMGDAPGDNNIAGALFVKPTGDFKVSGVEFVIWSSVGSPNTNSQHRAEFDFNLLT